MAMVRAQLSGETADAVAIVEKDHAAKMEALAAAHKTEMEKMQLELLWQRTEVDSLAGAYHPYLGPYPGPYLGLEWTAWQVQDKRTCLWLHRSLGTPANIPARAAT